MITFNVGPSKISDEVKKDIKKASDEDVLETSHRTENFNKMSEKTIKELRKFFNVPDSYKIFYTSSATEAMEFSVGNCCEKKAYHFVNGFFSNVFFKVSERYNKEVIKNEPEYTKQNNFQEAKIDKDVDFIALAHCETATGLMCSMDDIQMLRKRNTKAILTVDITSTAGAVPVDISLADIWFFSIQKGFGLPSGMGIMIVSEKAYKKSLELEKKRINLAGHFTFSRMWEEMDGNFQTACTPNILGIYLLGRQLERWNKNGGLKKKVKETKQKYKDLEEYFKSKKDLNFFIEEKKDRSSTLLYLKGREDMIKKIREACDKNGIFLGEGYAQARSYAIRIAIFPAITFNDLDKLKSTIDKVV